MKGCLNGSCNVSHGGIMRCLQPLMFLVICSYLGLVAAGGVVSEAKGNESSMFVPTKEWQVVKKG